MVTPLTHPLRRELLIKRRAYVLLIDAQGLKLTRKGAAATLEGLGLGRRGARERAVGVAAKNQRRAGAAFVPRVGPTGTPAARVPTLGAPGDRPEYRHVVARTPAPRGSRGEPQGAAVRRQASGRAEHIPAHRRRRGSSALTGPRVAPSNRHCGADRWLFGVSGDGIATVQGRRQPIALAARRGTARG